MQIGRITALVGAVLAIVGLVLKSASSGAEDLLATLNAANPAFPTGFDQVFGAMMDKNAAGTIVFIIALIAVLVLAVLGDRKEAMSRMNGLIATVLGVVMLLIGGYAITAALDDASDLQAALGQAAEAGMIPADIATATASFAWYLLAIGGLLAAIGGVLSLIARPNESALSE